MITRTNMQDDDGLLLLCRRLLPQETVELSQTSAKQPGAHQRIRNSCEITSTMLAVANGY